MLRSARAASCSRQGKSARLSAAGSENFPRTTSTDPRVRLGFTLSSVSCPLKMENPGFLTQSRKLRFKTACVGGQDSAASPASPPLSGTGLGLRPGPLGRCLPGALALTGSRGPTPSPPQQGAALRHGLRPSPCARLIPGLACAPPARPATCTTFWALASSGTLLSGVPSGQPTPPPLLPRRARAPSYVPLCSGIPLDFLGFLPFFSKHIPHPKAKC